MWMRIKQVCMDQTDGTCKPERVAVHHVDFAPTPRRNEYYIPSHTLSNTTMAMYHKTSHSYYNKVVTVKTTDFDSSKHGKTWYIDKIDCGEEECPYFIRAAEDRTRGKVEKIYHLKYSIIFSLETDLRKRTSWSLSD